MTDYAGRNAVVLGLGLTGLTLARWLSRHGATVRVADTRPHPPNAARLADELPGVRLETGPVTASTLAGADLIAITNVAHTIKGAAANVGAQRVALAASRLERQAAVDPPERLGERFLELDRHLAEFERIVAAARSSILAGAAT